MHCTIYTLLKGKSKRGQAGKTLGREVYVIVRDCFGRFECFSSTETTECFRQRIETDQS
jgi:hypothetical protein